MNSAATGSVESAVAHVPAGGDRAGPVEGSGLALRRIRPLWVERIGLFGRHLGLVGGVAILLAYASAAFVGLSENAGHLATLPRNPAWAYAFVAPGPSAQHPLGTMRGLGVDVLQAIVQATPWDLALVGGILLFAAGIGWFLGARAGLDRRGGLDASITGWADMVAGAPPFFLVLVLFLGLRALIPVSDYLLVFGLLFVFVLWPYYARTVRVRARQVADEPYVEAARASGARSWRILRRHVLPNSLFPVLAQVPVDVYNIFFVLTAFPFFQCFTGLGASMGGLVPVTQSPLPSSGFPEWGNLLANGACWGWSILPDLNQWWGYAFPALAIFGLGLAVTLVCDGLLRALAREVRA